MFDSARYIDTVDPEVDQTSTLRFKAFRQGLAGRSRIAWGEHCSECAAPSCYSNCAFYSPRVEDLNCGRFVGGIRKGLLEGHIRTATIRFGMWGKLEGKGPVGVVSLDASERWESVDELVTTSISRVAPNFAIRQIKWRWDNYKLRQFRSGDLQPDAFVLEAWLPPGAPTTSLSISFVPVESTDRGVFQELVRLNPGYNCPVVDIQRIRQRVDLDAPYFVRVEPMEERAHPDITFGLIDFVKFKAPQGMAASPAPAPRAKPGAAGPTPTKVKCVIWDLDNTLWSGTLAEDGLAGLTLNPTAVSVIRELDARGILHSIASKNDAEPAMEALRHFGLAEYFLCPQINWGPKSASCKKIAEILDIGLDTFVFVDDQPFERAEVSENLPMLRVLDDREVASIVSHPWFDVPKTAESAQRREMYRAEELRKSTLEENPGDYLDFLRGCALTLTARQLDRDMLERAYELSQRTNQLNSSGKRFERQDLERFISREDPRHAFIFRCSDRFGDYGYIALCVLDPRTAEIDSFMMSCRVQRKKVEQALFQWLASFAASRGLDAVSVVYAKTSKNGASVKMFKELGFEYVGDEKAGVFRRAVDPPIEHHDIVALKNDACV
jgi:FkbH-like protein